MDQLSEHSEKCRMIYENSGSSGMFNKAEKFRSNVNDAREEERFVLDFLVAVWLSNER